ncbi:unnamed protein product [Adineta steineri]|uniref:Uncharacterized protein n=1 Tax=Adineta steineri TaxID=433720 RepID=A0A819X602_9BILA|nr:unnamed protein product [Adineta steineri]CAF4131389.1 unnamed protein product [Adineta steineri]
MGNASMAMASNKINVKPRPSIVQPVSREPSHTSEGDVQSSASSSTVVYMESERSPTFTTMLDNMPMIKQNIDEQDRTLWRQVINREKMMSMYYTTF